MSNKGRSYNQFCALAKALDIVGERWTLLIARELLSGPKRFKDLLDALPGIGTNLLSTRMKDMERHGIVARAKLPPPAASAVYELTDRGRELGSVLGALTQWGFALLGAPEPGEYFQPRWVMQALLFTFVPEQAQGIAETYQFQIDGEAFYFRVSDGKAEGQLGMAADPDLLVVATSEEFLTMGFGDNQAEFVQQHDLIRKGNLETLHRFGRIFGVRRNAN